MIITTELTQPIIKQMIDVLDYNINIMNEEGVIVASADESRINQKHQGAVEVMQHKCERVVYPKDSERLPGTKPGVNLPIEFHGEIIGTVGITGHPDEVYKTAQIVKITVEALLQQQYLDERLRYTQKAVDEWVTDLINSRFNDISELDARSKMLKLNLSKKGVIFAIQLNFVNEGQGLSFNRIIQKNKTSILQFLRFYCPDALFIAHIGLGRFIVAIPIMNSSNIHTTVAKASSIHQKLQAKGWNNKIGIGKTTSGIIGYRESATEAILSLNILIRTGLNQQIAHIDEWGVLRLIFEIPSESREAYISRKLNNKEPLEPELMNTLETFLDCNQHIGQTVARLHIHRNTLLYRLDKIKQLWGLDPRNFKDALELQLLRFCLILRSESLTE